MLFISVAVFGFMAAQLAQRTSELESMVMAVGKRVVEMNVAFGEFTAVTDSLDQLRLTQETFRDSVYQLTERVNGMTETLQAVRSEVPVTTAESVGRQSEVFTARVSDVEGQIQAQQKITGDLAKSMQGLAGQMSSLRKQIASVSELNKDVEALVTLQREDITSCCKLKPMQPRHKARQLNLKQIKLLFGIQILMHLYRFRNRSTKS